jgi:hypothetical protein
MDLKDTIDRSRITSIYPDETDPNTPPSQIVEPPPEMVFGDSGVSDVLIGSKKDKNMSLYAAVNGRNKISKDEMKECDMKLSPFAQACINIINGVKKLSK